MAHTYPIFSEKTMKHIVLGICAATMLANIAIADDCKKKVVVCCKSKINAKTCRFPLSYTDALARAEVADKAEVQVKDLTAQLKALQAELVAARNSHTKLSAEVAATKVNLASNVQLRKLADSQRAQAEANREEAVKQRAIAEANAQKAIAARIAALKARDVAIAAQKAEQLAKIAAVKAQKAEATAKIAAVKARDEAIKAKLVTELSLKKAEEAQKAEAVARQAAEANLAAANAALAAAKKAEEGAAKKEEPAKVKEDKKADDASADAAKDDAK
jgi:hypothetical protein